MLNTQCIDFFLFLFYLKLKCSQCVFCVISVWRCGVAAHLGTPAEVTGVKPV